MRFISATQLFSGKEFLPQNTVIALNKEGKIADITNTSEIDNTNIDHYEGIICPGFINTHCHLELSHLKNAIPKHTGIVNFGLEIIKQRNNTPLEEQIELMHLADKEMQKNGIVAVGDISNGNSSIAIKKESALFYHNFIELIALNPEKANEVFVNGLRLKYEFKNAGLTTSLAAHAPYSCSPELIQKIQADCRTSFLPTTIHNQESEAENIFFESKTGDYIRLYEALELPLDFFSKTEKSSLKSTLNSFSPSISTLLVHNTFSSEDDIMEAKKYHENLFWCLCPIANEYIEKAVPPIQLLHQEDCKLTIGTDSLASNHQLSIIEEINYIQNQFPDFSIGVLLKAATYNGAQFLKINHQFGSFAINKKPGINLITGEKGNLKVKVLA